VTKLTPNFKTKQGPLCSHNGSLGFCNPAGLI
jgi:hypothetical protein